MPSPLSIPLPDRALVLRDGRLHPDFRRFLLEFATVAVNLADLGGDHGVIGGLEDDDHPQYHTNARGDARYSPLGHGHPYEPELGNPASDGQVLSSTAAGVRSWVTPAAGGGGPEFTTIFKAADTARQGSNAHVDDPELSGVALDPESMYRFELMLVYTADAAFDMRFRVQRSGLSDAELRYSSDLDNSAAATLTWASNINCAGTGTGTVLMGNYIGFIRTGTDPGSISVQWGQQTVGAVDTVMRAGSMLTVRKVS